MISDLKKTPTRRTRIRMVRFLLLTLLVHASCDDYLDEVPDDRVALDNLEKASQLLTNAYSASSYAFTDWMTDNTGYITGVTIRPNQEEAYTWSEFSAGPTEQDTPVFFWFETYTAIAHANEVLAVLESFPAESEEQQLRKQAVEAEALLTRAYGHFMLVNLFAKHYNEESAASDLGVPYVETPETVFIKQYKRNTVAEVYDKVERDMLKGIELVNDNFYNNSGKYHFNENAALAFASRFYLFKGEFDQCIAFSTELLSADPSTFVRDLTSQEFQAAKSSIQGYPQLYSSPDLPGNLLLMRKISLVQRTDFGHGPTQSFYGSLFATHPFEGVTDERENPAFIKGNNGLFPVRYESLFERSGLNSNVGYPYHIALAFRGEEVLLNRAEAYVYQHRMADALDDLQTLTNRRYAVNQAGTPPPVLSMPLLRAFFGSNNDPAVLINYILLERRKEFIAQGLRWFDIKRYAIPVTHFLADETSMVRLESEDPKKVLQIPSSAVDVGGLEPNPR